MTTNLKKTYKMAKKAGDRLSELNAERIEIFRSNAYGNTVPVEEREKDLRRLNEKINKEEQEYRLALAVLREEVESELKSL